MMEFPVFIVLVFAACVHVLAAQCPDGASPLEHHYCGRGGNPCPSYSYCNIAPNDAYAVCCPSHCESGSPLLGTDGNPIYCGRGGERCPLNYMCEIAPNDAWAVCCPQ